MTVLRAKIVLRMKGISYCIVSIFKSVPSNFFELFDKGHGHFGKHTLQFHKSGVCNSVNDLSVSLFHVFG